MRKITIFLCLIFSGFIFCGQNRNDSYNSLLWRISGNGLTKPSYIYGTIHITDKRVFYFSDSLYKALGQSEGFAAEMDISNFFSDYFGKMSGEKKKHSDKLLVDSLDKETLKKYKAKLEKKFNKPLNKITVGDIQDAKDEWMNYVFKNGEMNTLMDAWLFDVARRQGKWVGGIEDLQDYDGLEDSISLVENIESYSDKPGEKNSLLEWMIGIYVRQELDSIDVRSDVFQGSRDALLVRRNIKMARRMDSLARIRSMFFAVGAAHIPSNEGVIYLLRRKGFTVTPVHSKNKIAPEIYSYEQIDLPWYNVEDTSGGYMIRMPGKPISNSIDGEGSPEMKMYFDIANMRCYMALTMPIPTTGKYDIDSALNNFVDYYKGTGDSITEKNIILDGHKGKEITGIFDENLMRMQFFVEQSTIVMTSVAGFKKQVLFGEDPDIFFNSLKIKSKPPVVRTNPTRTWQRYDFEKFGFSVELPAKYQRQELPTSDTTWEQSYFHAMDLSNTTFFGVMIATVKKGYYSNVDSAFFEQAAQNLTINMKAEIISQKHFSKGGYPAFTASAVSKNEKESIAIEMLIVHKGPRRYLLFTTADEKNAGEATKKYFNSLNFLEPDIKWQLQPAPDNSFTVWTPAEVLLSNSSGQPKNEIKYSIFDTTTSVQVYIGKEIFADYFWAKDDSTLLADKAKTFIGYNDSVIFNTEFRRGKIKGVDLLVQLNGTHNRKRLRALLNGDTLYTIYTFLPSQELETNNYKKLFTDFTLTNEVVSSVLFKRKPKDLLLALQTKDSTDFENARMVFDYVEFVPDDIPLLQHALMYPYYNYESDYYYSLNNSISILLQKLDSNYNSIAFIEENYSRLNGDNELLKPYLLGLLSEIKTKRSYELLKDLIVKWPPKTTKKYYFQNGLYDSLRLTRILYPEILSVANDTGLYEIIGELTVTMLDSNLIDVTMLRDNKDVIIRSAKRILSLSKEELEENSYSYTSIVKLLGKINLPETNDLVRRFGKINANHLKLDAIITLAANDLQPDAKDMLNLAKEDEFRSLLYSQLRGLKKLNLFPKTFLTQGWLAQSYMFEYSNEDDYSPDTIQFVGERIETYLGKKHKFFLYKICFTAEEGDAECYFGAVGPFSLDSKNVETNNELTEVHWDETYDQNRLNEWLKDMIIRTEKWKKENSGIK